MELMASDFDRTGHRPFHVIFGGRCGRFSLRTRNGHWPRSPNEQDFLGLVARRSLKPGQKRAPLQLPRVAAQVSVGRRPALLCVIAPYPDGGIHGGHYVVVWDRGNAGYVMSFHYPRGDRRLKPRGSDVRALLRAATSMTPNHQ
jgi:hypothetical protein